MYHDRLDTLRYSVSQRSDSAGITDPSDPLSAKVVCGLLLPLDVIALLTTALIAYAVRLLADPYADWTEYAMIVAFGTLLAVNVFWLAGAYRPEIISRSGAAIRNVIVSWLCVAAALIVVGFLTKMSEEYSRAWSLLWLVSGLAGLIAVRWLFFSQVERWIAQGRLRRKIAIIGTGPMVGRLREQLAADRAAGAEVVGAFTDEALPRHAWHRPGAPIGDLDDLVSRIGHDAVDTVIVAVPRCTERRLHRITERLSGVPVDVRLCPGPVALNLKGRGVSHYAGIPTIDVVDRPLSDWRSTAKDVEDRLLGTLIFLMIAPVMLTIALLIKLDSPGPVLFRQKRYGYNNQLIEVFKFRTMRHDRQDENAATLTQRDDPRVTRLGALLRRWSLDELPQFINVLRGEMSIVGPRPHATQAKAGDHLYQEAVPSYASRHRVKPGITGWAQVNGWRGTTETVHQIEKRVEHDLYYIENWSLWFDLKIIFLTVFKGFGGQNAY